MGKEPSAGIILVGGRHAVALRSNSASPAPRRYRRSSDPPDAISFVPQQRAVIE